MKPAQLETWIWVLLYGGLLLLCLGAFVPGDSTLRLLLGVVGGVMTAAGVAGIVWRSRMDRR